MKRTSLFFVLILFCVFSSYSQSEYEITKEKKKYFQKGELLEMKTLRQILKENPSSSYNYEKYHRNSSLSNAFLGACSFSLLIGVLSNSFGPTIVGASFLVASLPFNVFARQHLGSSIEQYNSSLNTSSRIKYDIDFVTVPDGIGLIIRF